MPASLITTVQDVRDEIAGRLNEIESDNTIVYNGWINLTLRDIALSFPRAPFIQTSADRTLSSGTRIYPSFISDAEKINTITNPSNSTKLTFLSPEEFDIFAPSATQGGNPTIYTIRGFVQNGWFEFYPVPGSALTVHIDYEKSIDTISAGSASIVAIPAKYNELLVLGGEMRGNRRKLRYDLAKSIDADYQALKQKMMEDLMRQTSQMPRIKSVREFANSNNPVSVDPITTAFFTQL